MNPVLAVVLVLFAPRRFVEAAVGHDLEIEFEMNTEWLAKYPDRQVPPEKVEEIRLRAIQRTRKLRAAVFTAIGITVGAIICGLVAGRILRYFTGPAPLVATIVLQVIGAGVILGATLAEVGREIQSWKQQTLPEKVNRWVFRALYVVGTFVFVVSIGWA